MSRKYHIVLFAAISIIASNSFLSGCKAPCTYPDQNAVKVRIFNAMPDENVISIFVNGKLLAKDFPYDPKSNFIHDGTAFPFGYLSTYDDGSALLAGSSLPIIITSDGTGKDTILKTTVALDFHLQSLIIMGKGKGVLPGDAATKKVLRLVDDLQPKDSLKTLMRFVHAVPDLPSMDVFWLNKPDSSPNATVQYGVESPYLDLTNANFLKITEAGKPNNVIFSVPYKPTAIPGLILTTIIRGESKPYGSDKTASTYLLSDGNSTFGGLIVDFETFGLRFINGSDSLLNLLIQGWNDSLWHDDTPGQTAVLNIGPDSISGLWGLQPKLDSYRKYWFSRDLVWNGPDTLPGFRPPVVFLQDHRYSIIAVKNKMLGQTGRSIDPLILEDSMTSQPDMGRVRVVNLSPDHAQISFTLGGKSATLTKKQIAFFDVIPGSTTITLDDKTVQKDVTFSVPIGSPISVYIMPAKSSSDVYPIKISMDGNP